MKLKNLNITIVFIICWIAVYACGDKKEDVLPALDLKLERNSLNLLEGEQTTVAIVSGNGGYVVTSAPEGIVEARAMSSQEIRVTGLSEGTATVTVTDAKNETAIISAMITSPSTNPSAYVVEYQGKWYQAGDTIYGYKDYVKLVVGDIGVPLVLSAPHDGHIVPSDDEMPRINTAGRDIRTKPLTFGIAEEFKKDTGLQPWIVINEIHRQRMEPQTNKNAADNTYGVDSEGRKTYDSYHELILLARSTMKKHLDEAGAKGGLVIDMHGHSHSYVGNQEIAYPSVIDGSTLYSNYIRQSEVAYGISVERIELPDNELDAFAPNSSIYAIIKVNPGSTLSELVRGPFSLGTLLDNEGTIAVPSQNIPILERNASLFGTNTDGQPNRRPYYNGGYLVRTYGSATMPANGNIGFPDNIAAIQIEVPGITVRTPESDISRSKHQFKRAFINYINHWYGFHLPNSPYPYEYYKD